LNFLTAGESHGKSLVGIISDYPSGIFIDADFINLQLSRRQKGYGRGGRMSIEDDRVDIISGVRKGKSTGSPISFIIENRDWENWKDIMDAAPRKESGSRKENILTPRPGHADLTGILKYRLETIRDVIERSSARETAARVCTGAFAMTALHLMDINIFSYVERIGNVSMDIPPDIDDGNLPGLIEKSRVRCPDRKCSEKMTNAIDKAKRDGDSLGGNFKVIIKNVPPGLGSYTDWNSRLDARLAFALISIPAVKAFEIGKGFMSGSLSGLNYHDEILYTEDKGFYRKTNNAGGIEGGMSNGENIVIGGTMKPIPTTVSGMKTVNILNKEESISFKERSDICAVPSAAVAGEAVASIEIFNAIQEKFGRDNIDEILENMGNYKKYIESI
jgi:chorismate synthase